MVRPLLRNAVCWNRARIVSKSKSVVSKMFGVGPEGDRRPGLLRVLERLVLRQRSDRHALLERHPEHVAHLAHLDVEATRQGVDHRRADPVQPPGDLVAPTTELAAGVQLGQHQLDGGHVLAGPLTGGDAAAVVGDGDAAVGAQGDVDAVGEAGERLVDRVVDDLPDQVVQAALTRGPDVHARPLPHGFEALEDLDRGGVVGRGAVDHHREVRVEVRGIRSGALGDRSGRGRCVGLGHAAPSCAVRRAGSEESAVVPDAALFMTSGHTPSPHR